MALRRTDSIQPAGAPAAAGLSAGTAAARSSARQLGPDTAASYTAARPAGASHGTVAATAVSLTEPSRSEPRAQRAGSRARVARTAAADKG